ncbi:VacB/RNase II family 3'-5' exoribonuclease [Candidatus Marimicrobium litorale]|uniref:exoribonuclease II n=1 Tax=Candidatus Marimicrobium litorale TaxID=2518991 RepID=A0ABT3T9J8_9GAMM|nr:VacB/RNase II family 3'-5' exoribonuclease [Candidatus Marimicrobium litorale]MCX2978968.1 VacB/RNase II family 3'-5' exoribonuclease [Candidatus Marimicrobium litorale]
MLTQDNLTQLTDLKNQMEAAKERAEAVVKGTQARYGFAVLDDGREVFIPPQEMLKVFPNDRVQICIRPTKDNKTIADIEKLIDSPVEEFTGRCVRKGKAVFVVPDLPQFSRWLFLPTQARNGAKEGDFLRCAILRHPIRDGKPQAKVLSVLGDETTPGIEILYSISKHHLPNQWSKGSLNDIEKSLAEHPPETTLDRRDLTDLEFVTIDAAKTQDIDDALYAEISDDGWTLFVAIADPTAYVSTASRLYKDIAQRATSVYFHGDVLPMLPEILSQETCALSEGVDRPALVCKISVSDAGEVGEFEFIEATVRSRAKLSYYAVERYLNGQYDELMSHSTPLESLYQVYRALRSRREQNNLLMDDRQEFRWILNDNKQIETIETAEKLLSQKLVEECMVATNRCAARFLVTNNTTGPFIAHPGFRSDRREELKKFLEMHAPDLAELDPDTVQGYRDIIKGLSAEGRKLPLRTMANRLLTRAAVTTQHAPHMGMALDCYTNCTSPLRKYVDFLVHLQIKAILNKKEPTENVEETLLKGLRSRIGASREATMATDRWLAGNYLKRLTQDGGVTFKATVSHVTSSGFTARLTQNGLTGFVDLRKDPEKFSYDKWTASLTSTTRRFQIEQTVELSLIGLDDEISNQALFAPVPGCGLKTVATPAIQDATS